MEGIPPEEIVLTHEEVELYCNLPDIITLAGVLLPHMLQVGRSDQHEVVFTNHLAAVTYNAAHACSMFHKV